MKKITQFAVLTVMASIIMPKTIFAEETVTGIDTTTPIGTVVAYAGLESSTQLLTRGYMLCDGTSIRRVDYPNLFSIIGTTYGAADSSHFSLPNLNGKTIVGLDSSDSDFSTLGKTGGVKEVTLTVEQIPAHTHTFTGKATTTSSSGDHTHTFSGTTSSAGAHTHNTYAYRADDTSANVSDSIGKAAITTTWMKTYTIQKNDSVVQNGAHTHTYSGTTVSAGAHTHTFTASGTNSSTGGSKAHTNLQPYVTMKYMIKVK